MTFLSELLIEPRKVSTSRPTSKAVSGYRKTRSKQSSNKIGFLHTVRQPQGSNAYFNILRLQLESSKIRSLIKPHSPKSQVKLPKRGLAYSKCTCEATCTCGRRSLIQESLKKSTFTAFLRDIETVRTNAKQLKAKCSSEFGVLKQKSESLRKTMIN